MVACWDGFHTVHDNIITATFHNWSKGDINQIPGGFNSGFEVASDFNKRSFQFHVFSGRFQGNIKAKFKFYNVRFKASPRAALQEISISRNFKGGFRGDRKSDPEDDFTIGFKCDFNNVDLKTASSNSNGIKGGLKGDVKSDSACGLKSGFPGDFAGDLSNFRYLGAFDSEPVHSRGVKGGFKGEFKGDSASDLRGEFQNGISGGSYCGCKEVANHSDFNSDCEGDYKGDSASAFRTANSSDADGVKSDVIGGFVCQRCQ